MWGKEKFLKEFFLPPHPYPFKNFQADFIFRFTLCAQILFPYVIVERSMLALVGVGALDDPKTKRLCKIIFERTM